MNAVIPLDYQGHSVRFNLDGWINATDIAKVFGKEPTQWLRQSTTVEYLVKLAEVLGINSVPQTELSNFKELDTGSRAFKTRALKLAKATGLVQVAAGRNGGTWFHPKMAVRFARWLSVDFEIWCDMQIDRLLRGEESFRQQIDAAILAAEKQNEKGSNAGRELALHRYRMPPLIKHRDTLLDQAQIAINFGGQS